MTDFKQFIRPEGICFLEGVNTRREALDRLIEFAKENHNLLSTKEFSQAVLEREHIVSTGIGLGVALPHAKLPEIDDFFVILGIAPYGIEWEALDDIPVKLIFLIGGPDDKQTEYLQILSSLTMAINHEDKRKELLSLTNPEDIVNVLISE